MGVRHPVVASLPGCFGEQSMTGSKKDPTKVFDALLASLEKAAVCNANVHRAPIAILWSDHGWQWCPLMPVLQEVIPHMSTLGDCAPEARTEPVIRLECMIPRALPQEPSAPRGAAVARAATRTFGTRS